MSKVSNSVQQMRSCMQAVRIASRTMIPLFPRVSPEHACAECAWSMTGSVAWCRAAQCGVDGNPACAGGNSDPVMYGFAGRSFNFMGEVGKIYNIISTQTLQVWHSPSMHALAAQCQLTWQAANFTVTRTHDSTNSAFHPTRLEMSCGEGVLSGLEIDYTPRAVQRL